jgi:cell filamentation protein
MSRIVWRWEEKDFGFRFREGSGAREQEYYQAAHPNEFYTVGKSNRKLKRLDADRLAAAASPPAGPRVVANPWQNYQHSDWDQITTASGELCINWAGCLDPEEVARREDEGVQRARELIIRKLELAVPAPININLIRQVHVELMGNIYPFAGQWRRVSMTKGSGPEKWPLPPTGIHPLMEEFERKVLSRTPFFSADDDDVFAFIAELMMEFIAIHPFREGNGRSAFILADLVLLQNDMIPLIAWRKSDEPHYFDACEAGRVHCEYEPMKSLLRQWQDAALQQWRGQK